MTVTVFAILEPVHEPVSLNCRVAGSGDPIVLVHGVAADATTFRVLEPSLAERFTVVSVDRRGRFGSADRDVYSLEAEFADLVRIVDALPAPVTVFGHSFGGNVALGAALLGANISHLVLYEPGRRGDVSAELHDELGRLLGNDDRVGAMRLALLEFTRFPDEWLDDLLETPPWQERLSYAHTIARELRAYDEYEYGDLSRLATPTLLLVGGASPATELEHAHTLARVLPSAEVVVLPGQGHVATVTAPQLVKSAIATFVDANS
jgi:pimeloyl-ACP methyl ester carboxylesterase